MKVAVRCPSCGNGVFWNQAQGTWMECPYCGLDLYGAFYQPEPKTIKGKTYFIGGIGLYFPFVGLPQIVRVKSRQAKPFAGQFVYDY